MAVEYFQRTLQFSINLFQAPTFFSRWWEVTMTTYSVLRPICMNRFIFLVLDCWSWCRHWLMDFQPTNPCTLLSFGESISKETHWNLHVFLSLIRLSLSLPTCFFPRPTLLSWPPTHFFDVSFFGSAHRHLQASHVLEHFPEVGGWHCALGFDLRMCAWSPQPGNNTECPRQG